MSNYGKGAFSGAREDKARSWAAIMMTKVLGSHEKSADRSC